MRKFLLGYTLALVALVACGYDIPVSNAGVNVAIADWIIYAAIAVAVAGTASSTYATVQQTQTQNKAAKYKQKVGEMNAELVRQEAAEAQKLHRRKVSLLAGQQRAAFGVLGVDLDAGSASALVDETYQLGQEDAQMIAWQNARKAWAYEAQADYDGGMTTSPLLTGTDSLLSGATSTITTYAALK